MLLECLEIFFVVGVNMYKLVVSGFDGTLLDDDLAISVSTVLTIDEIRRKNCKFVVATGREISFVKEYIKDVNFIDYIIALNGSYIYDVLKDQLIFDQGMKKMAIRKVIKQYEKQDVKIYLCTDHSKCLWNVKNEETEDIVIRDLNDFLKNNKVYKIEIHSKTLKRGKEILKELKSGQFVFNLNLHKYDDKDYLVEITNENVSKYTATMFIAKRENIKKQEIVAYGDYYNDLELVKKVGCGIAVNNAIRELKLISKKTTLSNSLKGVEKSLKQIFLSDVKY